MKKNIFLLLIITLLLLPACKNSHNSLGVKKNPGKNVSKRNYMLLIEGIECRFCAQTVVDHLEGIQGITEVTMHKVNGAYTDGYLTFSFEPVATSIPLKEIVTRFSQDGFIMKGLHGVFEGRFKEEDWKKFIALLGNQLRIAVVKNLALEPYSQREWKLLKRRKRYTALAMVWYHPDNHNYYLTLDTESFITP